MAKVELDVNYKRTLFRATRPDLAEVVDDLAADAAALARGEAYGQGEHGHYADQISGRTDEDRGQVVGYIEARKFTSGWLEYGTVHMDGRHIIERTVRGSGLPVRLAPRRNRSGGRGSRFRRASA